MRLHAIPGLSGLIVFLSAAILWAQAAQDWIPEEIALPDDMEVTVDRAIGSSTRIFSFITSQETAPLLDDWRQSLQDGGYVIEEPSAEALEGREIQFSGPGIGNAKIAIQPSAEGGRNLVQFDASLVD